MADITSSVSSVELKRDAKGNHNITVKVYDEDPDTAKDKAIELYDVLVEKYPMED